MARMDIWKAGTDLGVRGRQASKEMVICYVSWEDMKDMLHLF